MIHKNTRNKLLNQLDDNAVAIISTNCEQLRSNDVYYPFRPNSDFWYLTGFKEPQAVAVFSRDSYTIFLRDNDPKRTLWDGECLGVSKAPKALKADNAYDISQLKSILPQLISNNSQVYYDFKPSVFDDIIVKLLSKSQSLKPYVHEMRLIKSPREIALMQKAADISVNAHKLAMQQTQDGKFEYEIASVFDAHFKQNNTEHAYAPIVAGGKNSCILHYINNNQIVKNGDLLLVDAGCEVEGYAADITRTFPINGKFSPAQRAIYQIVLDAQNAAINSILPGKSVHAPHKIAADIVQQGLIDLGILQTGGNVKQFFMHGTGHWLGLDVHDVGQYKVNNKSRLFEAGMVSTVEPGIYILSDDKIDPIYWNIGIRIEDDILVTEDGHQILTSALAREINEIEQLMER